MEIFSGVADVCSLKLGQSLDYPIYHYIRVMFRIADPVGNKDTNKAGANYFITLTSLLAIGIQPLKQRFK